MSPWGRVSRSFGLAYRAVRIIGVVPAGSERLPSFLTWKPKPSAFFNAYHWPPAGVVSRSAARELGSPIAENTYGGLTGWSFTRIPVPTLRNDVSTVIRSPLTLI